MTRKQYLLAYVHAGKTSDGVALPVVMRQTVSETTMLLLLLQLLLAAQFASISERRRVIRVVCLTASSLSERSTRRAAPRESAKRLGD